MRKHIIEDWHWVLNHSWSVRLLALAFILSAAEVIMPLFTDYRHPVLYAIAMGVVTGGAFVARFIVQNKVKL